MSNVNKSRKKAKKSEAIAPESGRTKRRPPRRPESKPLPRPPLAVRSDGAVLLRIEDGSDLDLAGRELWLGVVLHPDELVDVLARVENCAHEAAARIGANLPKKRARSK